MEIALIAQSSISLVDKAHRCRCMHVLDDSALPSWPTLSSVKHLLLWSLVRDSGSSSLGPTVNYGLILLSSFAKDPVWMFLSSGGLHTYAAGCMAAKKYRGSD